MTFTRTSIFWLFVLLFITSIDAQKSGLAGLPIIYNYSPAQYGFHPQNWSAVQDGRGMLYFANTDGILEYDGVKWRMIRMPYGQVCRTLFRASDGTIYVGGYNEIGKLVSDNHGKTEYHSLRSTLKGLPEEFYDIWSIAELNGGIYFSSYNDIFVLEGNKFSGIKSEYPVSTIKNINGNIIVVRSGRFPEILSGKRFVPLVAAGSQPASQGYSVTKGSGNSVIVIGQSGEFYSVEAGNLKQLSKGLEIFSSKSNFYDAVRLSNGNVAIATTRKGLVICTEEGALIRVLDEARGFGNNTVYSLFEDDRKNIWGMMENGISRINIADPLSIFDKRVSLPGSIGDVTFADGHLFVASNFGVLSSDNTLHGDKTIFKPYAVEIGDGWRITKTENDLLAAASNGLFILRNNSAIQLDNSYSIDVLSPTEAPDILILSTDSGLKLLRMDANRTRVISSFRVNGIETELRGVFQRREGEFWINSVTGTIFRVIFNKGFEKQPEVTPFPEKDQNIGHRPQIIVTDGEVLAATGKGLHIFDDNQGKFIPLKSNFVFETADPFSFPLITSCQNEELIFYSEGHLFYVKVDFSKRSCSFDRFGKVRSTAVYKLVYDGINSPGILWLATSNGLLKYELTRKFSDKKSNSVIRSITVNDSLFFFGATSAGENLEIDPGNSATFTFSTLGIFDEANVLFQTMMEGIDTSWQKPTKNSFREFVKLAPGEYKFKVRAILPTGEVATEASFTLIVANYWYSNIYAYILYAFILFGGFFLFIRVRTTKLVKERTQLEYAVNERTKKLNEALSEINNRNDLLKESNSKLLQLNKEKSEYLGVVAHDLKSPILGIMGFAEIISDELQDLEQDDVRRFANNISNSSGKILETINRLLDVNMIEEGKIELRLEEFDLVSLVSETVSLAIPHARNKNIVINFRSEVEKLQIESDRSLSGQVFDNLISNALKYSFSDSKVKVRIRLKDQSAFVEVEDQGQGISEEELPMIYDRFKRLSSKPTAGESSTGLGLNIVKNLVNLLHGKISIKSKVGEGSTFTIELPVKFGSRRD